MSWDIEVHEKVYQRLANEIFFRILRGEYALGAKLPSYDYLLYYDKAFEKMEVMTIWEISRSGFKRFRQADW